MATPSAIKLIRSHQWRRGWLSVATAIVLCAVGSVTDAQPNGSVEPKLTALKRLEAMFMDIEHEIERLEKAEQFDDAAAMRRAVEAARVQLKEGYRPDDKPQIEVHAVAIHEGQYPDGRPRPNFHKQGIAAVEVKEFGQPIVLALSAYEPVRWRINIDPAAQVQRVLLSGHYKQELEGLPDSVHVETRSARAQEQVFFLTSDAKTAAKQLLRTTKLPLATFQYARNYPGRPFVVGSDNRDWIAQQLIRRIAPLHERALRFEQAQRRDKVQAIRFRAMHYEFGPRPHEVKHYLAQFTPAGPIVNTLVPVPSNFSRIAVDPKGPTYYAIQSHSVVTFDLESGRTTQLQIDDEFPELSWPAGLTFDTKRRRLVLTSIGGDGYFYVYEPDKNKWSVPETLNNEDDPHCLSYSPEEDVHYGIHFNHDDHRFWVVKYSPDGKLLDKTMVESDRKFASGPPTDLAQIVAVGKQIVVLTRPGHFRGSDEERPAIRSYLIDPRTGKILFTDALQMHAGSKELEPVRISKLWEGLAGRDVAEIDRFMWDLAAGGENTIAYFRQQFVEPPEVDRERITQLIEQLDHDNFQVRENAMKELAKLGFAPQQALKRALMSGSAEVRNRARRLLNELESDESSDPETQREVRAVQVLGRMTTPKAIEYLEELAKGEPTVRRTQQAKSVLRRFGK